MIAIPDSPERTQPRSSEVSKAWLPALDQAFLTLALLTFVAGGFFVERFVLRQLGGVAHPQPLHMRNQKHPSLAPVVTVKKTAYMHWQMLPRGQNPLC